MVFWQELSNHEKHKRRDLGNPERVSVKEKKTNAR